MSEIRDISPIISKLEQIGDVLNNVREKANKPIEQKIIVDDDKAQKSLDEFSEKKKELEKQTKKPIKQKITTVIEDGDIEKNIESNVKNAQKIFDKYINKTIRASKSGNKTYKDYFTTDLNEAQEYLEKSVNNFSLSKDGRLIGGADVKAYGDLFVALGGDVSKLSDQIQDAYNKTLKLTSSSVDGFKELKDSFETLSNANIDVGAILKPTQDFVESTSSIKQRAKELLESTDDYSKFFKDIKVQDRIKEIVQAFKDADLENITEKQFSKFGVMFVELKTLFQDAGRTLPTEYESLLSNMARVSKAHTTNPNWVTELFSNGKTYHQFNQKAMLSDTDITGEAQNKVDKLYLNILEEIIKAEQKEETIVKEKSKQQIQLLTISENINEEHQEELDKLNNLKKAYNEYLKLKQKAKDTVGEIDEDKKFHPKEMAAEAYARFKSTNNGNYFDQAALLYEFYDAAQRSSGNKLPQLVENEKVSAKLLVRAQKIHEEWDKIGVSVNKSFAKNRYAFQQQEDIIINGKKEELQLEKEISSEREASTSPIIEQQNKIQEELKETQEQAEETVKILSDKEYNKALLRMQERTKDIKNKSYQKFKPEDFVDKELAYQIRTISSSGDSWIAETFKSLKEAKAALKNYPTDLGETYEIEKIERAKIAIEQLNELNEKARLANERLKVELAQSYEETTTAINQQIQAEEKLIEVEKEVDQNGLLSGDKIEEDHFLPKELRISDDLNDLMDKAELSTEEIKALIDELERLYSIDGSKYTEEQSMAAVEELILLQDKIASQDGMSVLPLGTFDVVEQYRNQLDSLIKKQKEVAQPNKSDISNELVENIIKAEKPLEEITADTKHLFDLLDAGMDKPFSPIVEGAEKTKESVEETIQTLKEFTKKGLTSELQSRGFGKNIPNMMREILGDTSTTSTNGKYIVVWEKVEEIIKRVRQEMYDTTNKIHEQSEAYEELAKNVIETGAVSDTNPITDAEDIAIMEMFATTQREVVEQQEELTRQRESRLAKNIYADCEALNVESASMEELLSLQKRLNDYSESNKHDLIAAKYKSLINGEILSRLAEAVEIEKKELDVLKQEEQQAEQTAEAKKKIISQTGLRSPGEDYSYIERTMSGQLQTMVGKWNGYGWDESVASTKTHFESVEKAILKADAAIIKLNDDKEKALYKNKNADVSGIEAQMQIEFQNRSELLKAIVEYGKEDEYVYQTISEFLVQRREIYQALDSRAEQARASQREMDQGTNANKDRNSDLKKDIELAKRYYELREKVANNTASPKELNDFQKLNDIYNDLIIGVQKYTAEQTASKASIDAVNNSVEKLTSSFEEGGFEDYVHKSSNELIKLKEKLKDYRKSPIVDKDAAENTKNAIKDIDYMLEQLARSYEDISNTEGMDAFMLSMSRGKQSVRELGDQLDGLSNKLSLEKLNTRIAKTLKDNSAMTSSHKMAFKELQNQIKSFSDNGITPTKDNVQELALAFQRLETEVYASGRTGKNMFDRLRDSIKTSTAQFLTMYFSIQDWVRYLRQAFNSVKELDTALVDLRKTAQMSNEELNSFYFRSNDIAKEMGVTTQAIIEQASAWSRLGYSSANEVEKMAKLSSQFASISPGMDTTKAQEGLVSAMKGFKIEVEDVQREIMDNVNKIGKYICRLI